MLDTRDKRASALGDCLDWQTVYPNPDGDLDDGGDRLQMASLYRGISAGTLFQILGAPVVSALRQAKVTSQRFAKAFSQLQNRIKADV